MKERAEGQFGQLEQIEESMDEKGKKDAVGKEQRNLDLLPIWPQYHMCAEASAAVSSRVKQEIWCRICLISFSTVMKTES